MTTAHSYPLDDLIEHGLTEDCACGPTTEPVMRRDGSNGWVVVHHSLDGREATEPAVKNPGWRTELVSE